MDTSARAVDPSVVDRHRLGRRGARWTENDPTGDHSSEIAAAKAEISTLEPKVEQLQEYLRDLPSLEKQLEQQAYDYLTSRQ